MHFQSTRTIELYAVHYFQHCSIFSLPLWYRLPPTVPIPASTSGGAWRRMHWSVGALVVGALVVGRL